MANFTYTIANGADDGNVAASPTLWNNSYWFLGNYMAAYTLFSGITIPQGTTIVSATLRLNLCQRGAWAAAAIRADNRSNPSPNATTIRDVSNVLAGYVNTGGSTAGYYPNLFTKTNGNEHNPADYIEINPNVTSFVQSLVNSHDYNNGKIMFKYLDRGGSGFAFFYAKDQGATKAPKLIINYASEPVLVNKTVYRFL